MSHSNLVAGPSLELRTLSARAVPITSHYLLPCLLLGDRRSYNLPKETSQISPRILELGLLAVSTLGAQGGGNGMTCPSAGPLSQTWPWVLQLLQG